MRTHDLVEDPITLFASLAVAIYAFATIALWFVSRPYGVQRLRLACTSALVSAAVCTLARPLIERLTALAARITDPSLRRIWQLGGRLAHD